MKVDPQTPAAPPSPPSPPSPTSPTRRDPISRRARAVPASGIRRFFDIINTMQDVISLGVGEPDFVTPLHIRQAGIRSLQEGHTAYTSNFGTLALRRAIAREVEGRYGVAYDPEDRASEIIVTAGVSEALDLAIRATIDPGDEVIVPEPSYVSYAPCVVFAGGTPVTVATTADQGFAITARQVAAAITPRTKAILLGYPNNPTGTAVSRAELTAIVRLAVEHDLLLYSDEIYSRLVYEGWDHTCVAALPGARDRTVLLNGLSKSYAMTGWRVGYACAPAEILEAMMKVHQYGLLCAPTTAQEAAVEALEHGEPDVQAMLAEYARRREMFVDGLNRIGLECARPQGAFYAFPSIARSGLSSDAFAEGLLYGEKVAVVPGSAFGPSGEGHVRMCYATSYEKLQEALRRIERFLQRLERGGESGGRGRAAGTSTGVRPAATAAPAAPAGVEYEPVIGLEVHAQLLTESKMFCACSARYAGAGPNSLVCPVCLGMPGVLPVINERAVEFTVLTALALNCEIPEYSKFDRKNYNYPDLMKGYQISQFDLPLSQNGHLEIPDPAAAGETRRIGITRVHLEEDTANLKHERDVTGETYSLMDVNRSGVPLMEIVGEPDLRSPEEAGAYLRELRAVLRYIAVSTAHMEEGAFRCDANVSLRPVGATALGAKVEVKNMNSFRAVERALAFEITRQAEVLRAGGRIPQETRGWVEERGVTVSQRSKEEAHDYRYFPEPDLPPLFLTADRVDGVRARLPELPAPKRRRFAEQYGLSPPDAFTLTATRDLANFYEATVEQGAGPRPTANWILRDVLRLVNAAGGELESGRLSPANLASLIELVEFGALTRASGTEVLEESFRTGADPAVLVKEKGLTQVSDAGALDAIVEGVLADPKSQKAVVDFRAGKENAVMFLVGAVMKQTRGRANAGVVRDLLKRRLEAETSSDRN